MKAKIYIPALLTAALAVSCHRGPEFHVEGEVAGAADKTLYFEHSGLDGVSVIDSLRLNDAGKFSFSASRPDAPDFYRLRVDGKVINFVVDSTETVRLHADYATFIDKYTIDQSEDNAKIKELVALQSDLQARTTALTRSGLPVGVVQDSLKRMVDAYKDTVKRNYIFAAPNRPYAYFALFQQIDGYSIFDPLANKEDIKCFAAVATSMNNLYPHSDRSQNLYNMVIKGMKNTRTVQKPLDIPADKIKEASIIDIALPDLNGKVRHLTDLKGKVVLIDFTVYAAAESGARNLVLRDLYRKYASRGLEIYQISLDSDEHFWKTSADNLPWVCVRDPQGAYSTSARLYGVNQLPASFLVNRRNELSLRLDAKTDLEEAINKLL